MTEQPAGMPLPTTDATAAEGEKIVSTIIQDSVPVIENAAIVAEPLLGTPVFKQIWEAGFQWLMGMGSKVTGLLTGYVIIDVQQYMALRGAAKALADLNAAKQSGDQNAISQASSAVDNAVAPILHYIGDIRPK